MDTNSADAMCEKIRQQVGDGRLHDAFTNAISLAETQMAWERTRQLRDLEQSYKYMLHYAAEGADDPGRIAMRRSIGDQILTIVDRLERIGRKRDCSRAYYNTLRYESLQRADSIIGLIEQWERLGQETSLFEQVASGDTSKGSGSQEERERLEQRIFDRIWVSFPMAPETVEALANGLRENRWGDTLPRMIAGALILGELESHDEARLELMLDLYIESLDPALELLALIGLLLALATHRGRVMSDRLRQRLEAARELPTWHSDLSTAWLELVRTCDTERVIRKMRDEVLPGMMKLRPDIARKIKDEGNVNLADLEENPEWHELLDRSGISDKLKELSELQEEGADVMMGAFSNLKNFPFFRDVANWWRPFSAENTYVTRALGSGHQAVLDMLVAAPMLCDSDKYSFALSIASIPESSRETMTRQLEAHSDQLAEMRMASEISTNAPRRGYMAMAIQNMYRFFHLYRRKGDFQDPFNADLDLSTVEALSQDLTDRKQRRLVAEFYFKRKYWQKALDMLLPLADNEGTGKEYATLFQKIGFCYQQLGDFEAALKAYEHANMLNEANHWTWRRLAQCYRQIGQMDKAIDYLRRLEEYYPDDTALAMILGHVLMEKGDIPAALEQYYKVDYIDGTSSKPWRAIAWCMLLTRDLDGADKYYNRILIEGQPSAEDYLNMGHLALVKNDFKEAINAYKTFIDLQGDGIEGFVKSFRADRDSLLQMGADPSLIPLVIDTIQYSLGPQTPETGA
ncbi:MAG: tetratricopeptide repeat protein [Bacteroidales bacterium]|nr:tetratricopeptide repeat protein [Bacteroidales bacterium]